MAVPEQLHDRHELRLTEPIDFNRVHRISDMWSVILMGKKGAAFCIIFSVFLMGIVTDPLTRMWT